MKNRIGNFGYLTNYNSQNSRISRSIYAIASPRSNNFQNSTLENTISSK